MKGEGGGSWAKAGCLVAGGLLLVVLVLLAVGALVASHQNRDARFERESYSPDLPVAAEPAAVRLDLRLHTAGLTVKPLEAGESIRVEADYDPRRHELLRASEREGPTLVMHVGLVPRGSKLMALLRAKMGGRPAMLRVGLPRDVALSIEGNLVRSFSMMELGGLELDSVRLEAEESGLKLSFAEPLARPMDTLSVAGSRGSVSIAGLGNASPRSTRVFQHIGAMDLDLRGEWSRDAQVRVIGGVAGGSLWLPDNVRLRGLENRFEAPPENGELTPRPTLTLSLSEHVGRLVILD